MSFLIPWWSCRCRGQRPHWPRRSSWRTVWRSSWPNALWPHRWGTYFMIHNELWLLSQNVDGGGRRDGPDPGQWRKEQRNTECLLLHEDRWPFCTCCRQCSWRCWTRIPCRCTRRCSYRASHEREKRAEPCIDARPWLSEEFHTASRMPLICV